MKLTTLLATFSLTFVIKFINGQQNGVVTSADFETINHILQQQPTQTMTKTVEGFLNNNGNIIRNNEIQNQVLMQENTPLPTPRTQQKQVPPDLQSQPLQVQQHLKLQTPLQLQQSLPLKPLQLQIQKQTLAQSHQPLQEQLHTHLPIQPYPPLQMEMKTPTLPSQNIIQLQPQLQAEPQPYIQTNPQLQGYPQVQAQLHPQIEPQPQLQVQQKSPSQQPLQLQHALRLHQPLQTKQNLQTHQSLPLQQSFQSQQPLLEQPFKLQPQQLLQSSQPLQPQKPLALQQTSLQNPTSISENINLVEAGITQQNNIYQPNPQTYVNWQSLNSQGSTKLLEKRSDVHLQKNPVIYPGEVTRDTQEALNRIQETSSFTYYLPSQQSAPSAPVLSASVPAISNSHSVQSYNPLVSSYNHNVPLPEAQPLVLEISKPVSSVSQSSSILTIPSPPIHSTQTYYYNQPIDTRQNAYINQNTGFHYPQQSSYPITVLQSQPTAIMPNQTPILSSVPISTQVTSVQVPSVFSQYGYSSRYPINSFVAPATGTKSSNFKSLLPLIFDLLREKIASCSCQDDCPCKNKSSGNELEVSSGYSVQKLYGSNAGEELSVLNTLSEESQGNECPRERKNCDVIETASREMSSETQEEEYSEEEEADDDHGEEE